MADKSKKSKKDIEYEQRIGELTADLQRTRADYENHVKRAESDRTNAHEYGQASAIMKLLPVIDNIERSISHMPDDLKDNAWAQGVASLTKNLDKSLESMGVSRIEAKVGDPFNPDLHDAISMDEDAVGEHEVIAEEMQSGYILNGQPVRHAMVRVTRK
ncbi:nucleotide exchange factor GrpE [Candidatus Saccharibacteria bacterium]|nr:nucleotide exchange factor GrpE [Candidatus Saccharibacteria bacterium]